LEKSRENYRTSLTILSDNELLRGSETDWYFVYLPEYRVPQYYKMVSKKLQTSKNESNLQKSIDNILESSKVIKSSPE
jgi:hypothetical protein